MLGVPDWLLGISNGRTLFLFPSVFVFMFVYFIYICLSWPILRVMSRDICVSHETVVKAIEPECRRACHVSDVVLGDYHKRDNEFDKLHSWWGNPPENFKCYSIISK